MPTPPRITSSAADVPLAREAAIARLQHAEAWIESWLPNSVTSDRGPGWITQVVAQRTYRIEWAPVEGGLATSTSVLRARGFRPHSSDTFTVRYLSAASSVLEMTGTVVRTTPIPAPSTVMMSHLCVAWSTRRVARRISVETDELLTLEAHERVQLPGWLVTAVLIGWVGLMTIVGNLIFAGLTGQLVWLLAAVAAGALLIALRRSRADDAEVWASGWWYAAIVAGFVAAAPSIGVPESGAIANIATLFARFSAAGLLLIGLYCLARGISRVSMASIARGLLTSVIGVVASMLVFTSTIYPGPMPRLLDDFVDTQRDRMFHLDQPVVAAPLPTSPTPVSTQDLVMPTLPDGWEQFVIGPNERKAYSATDFVHTRWSYATDALGLEEQIEESRNDVRYHEPDLRYVDTRLGSVFGGTPGAVISYEYDVDGVAHRRSVYVAVVSHIAYDATLDQVIERDGKPLDARGQQIVDDLRLPVQGASLPDARRA